MENKPKSKLKKIIIISSTIPEEYNKSICLNNHPYDGPSNDDQEEANTKGNRPLQST